MDNREKEIDMVSYPAAKRRGQTDTLMYAESERLFDRGLTRDEMNSLMERLQAKLGSKNKLAEAIYDRKNAASRVKQVMEGAQRYTDAVIDKILAIASVHQVPKIVDRDNADAITGNAPESTREDVIEPIASDNGRLPGENATETAEAATEAEPHETATVQTTDAAPQSPDFGMIEHEATASSHEADAPLEESAAADEKVTTPKDEPAEHHGADVADWLSGVHRKRAEIVEQVVVHDEAMATGQARAEWLRTEIARLEGEYAEAIVETTRAGRLRDAANAAIGEIDTALSILQTI